MGAEHEVPAAADARAVALRDHEAELVFSAVRYGDAFEQVRHFDARASRPQTVQGRNRGISAASEGGRAGPLAHDLQRA